MKMFLISSGEDDKVKRRDSPMYGMHLPYITKLNGVPLFVREGQDDVMPDSERVPVPPCMVGMDLIGDHFYVGVGDGDVMSIPLYTFDPVNDMLEAVSALSFILERLEDPKPIEGTAEAIRERVRTATQRSSYLAAEQRIVSRLPEPE